MLERERSQLEHDYSDRHERDRARLLAELNSARSKGAAELVQTRDENERLRQLELSRHRTEPNTSTYSILLLLMLHKTTVH